MIKILFRPVFRFSKFKLEDYQYEDYQTMCGLIREKYQLHNDQVQTTELVKLIDDSGRVIGMYTASEARKKANAINLDMILVNKSIRPIICKAVDFRRRVLTKFYEDVVVRAQKREQSRANSTKNIKVSPNLGKNDMIVKVKQITELSSKHAKVRVFMIIKQNQRDESLAKLQELKSLLMNKCYIEEELSNRRFEQQETQSEKPQSHIETFSFVIKAREFDVVKKPVEEVKENPDDAVKKFLAKYYSQDDGQMMDLRSAGLFETETGIIQSQQVPKIVQPAFNKQKTSLDVEMQRQAAARVLNRRLKVLLAFTI